jgi:hypothetical protein
MSIFGHESGRLPGPSSRRGSSAMSDKYLVLDRNVRFLEFLRGVE